MIRSSAATDSPRNPLEETTSRSLTRVAVDLLHPAVARSGPGLADGLQAQLDAAARLQVFQREAAPVLPEADLLQHAAATTGGVQVEGGEQEQGSAVVLRTHPRHRDTAAVPRRDPEEPGLPGTWGGDRPDVLL